jgi:hypothetical protein
MSENTEEVLETNDQVVEQPTEDNGPMSYDDGVIKVNLAELNKPQEDAVQEQSADASNDTVGESENTPSSEEVVEEVREPVQDEDQPVQNEETVLEEITEEEVKEQTQELQEEVEQEIQHSQDTGAPLPENIQKVVEFINETGGSLEDYVKLNTDYSALNEAQLIREYYETTKPHLDKEDIEVLMEDFSYDEELDEPKDIRKAKIAFKEEAAKAKQHLEKLKSNYYEEIKAGSRLNPEQQKAVEFFNRYKKDNEESTKIAEHQASIFKNKTENLFSNDFKGFDFNVGEKKFRFKVNNTDQVKTTQSDINNFVKKFLNDKNEMKDAAGYHKSLFTAMNADAIANHFYEQGKSDAIKNSMAKAKNIDMDPRGTHENVKASNGWTVRSISSSASSSKLKIKSKR